MPNWKQNPRYTAHVTRLAQVEAEGRALAAHVEACERELSAAEAQLEAIKRARDDGQLAHADTRAARAVIDGHRRALAAADQALADNEEERRRLSTELELLKEQLQRSAVAGLVDTYKQRLRRLDRELAAAAATQQEAQALANTIENELERFGPEARRILGVSADILGLANHWELLQDGAETGVGGKMAAFREDARRFGVLPVEG